MDKEEYREEVIRQLKEQNNILRDIDNNILCGSIIIIFILVILVGLIVWQNFAIGNMEIILERFKDLNDPLNPFYQIQNILENLETLLRWNL